MTLAPKRRWQFSLQALLLWGVPLCAACAFVLVTDESPMIKLAKITIVVDLWVVLRLYKEIRNRQRAADLPTIVAHPPSGYDPEDRQAILRLLGLGIVMAALWWWINHS